MRGEYLEEEKRGRGKKSEGEEGKGKGMCAACTDTCSAPRCDATPLYSRPW